MYYLEAVQHMLSALPGESEVPSEKKSNQTIQSNKFSAAAQLFLASYNRQWKIEGKVLPP